jgi:hypothetical protein
LSVLSAPWTAPSGWDHAAITGALEKANLSFALQGKNGAPSAFALNLASLAIRETLRRSIKADAGPAALLGFSPIANGQTVTIPAQAVAVLGEIIQLSGTGGDSAAVFIDMTTYAVGDWAVVLETWNALVGPSTDSGLLPPTALAGITDTVNKKSSTLFYPLGNVDRTGGGDGQPDSALVAGTSVQIQKFIQPQYRIRVISDRTLVGLAVNGAAGLHYSAMPDNPLVVKAVTPHTEQAFDGTYHAVKLCIIRKTSSSVTAFTQGLQPSGWTPQGQEPVPVLPSRALIAVALSDSLAGLPAHIASGNAHDASAIGYQPGDTSKWNGNVDPGQTDDALDQLASRVKAVEAVSSANTGSPLALNKSQSGTITRVGGGGDGPWTDTLALYNPDPTRYVCEIVAFRVTSWYSNSGNPNGHETVNKWARPTQTAQSFTVDSSGNNPAACFYGTIIAGGNSNETLQVQVARPGGSIADQYRIEALYRLTDLSVFTQR